MEKLEQFFSLILHFREERKCSNWVSSTLGAGSSAGKVGGDFEDFKPR